MCTCSFNIHQVIKNLRKEIVTVTKMGWPHLTILVNNPIPEKHSNRNNLIAKLFSPCMQPCIALKQLSQTDTCKHWHTESRNLFADFHFATPMHKPHIYFLVVTAMCLSLSCKLPHIGFHNILMHLRLTNATLMVVHGGAKTKKDNEKSANEMKPDTEKGKSQPRSSPEIPRPGTEQLRV